MRKRTVSDVDNMGIKAPRFRLLFFFPLVVALLFLLVSAVLGFYLYSSQKLEKNVDLKVESVEKMFNMQWADDALLLESLISLVKKSRCVQNKFATRDRAALLDCANPIFENFKKNFNITHFYFHTPDRSSFLRMHQPSRHGDTIKRFTMDEAFNSGKASSGIEIGPYGHFTLRVVHPWIVDGEMIGYLELGEEINRFTQNIKELMGVELLFLIEKRYANRQMWEKGQKVLGNNEDWDEYPDLVVIDRTAQIWAHDLYTLHETMHQDEDSLHEVSEHGHEDGVHFEVTVDGDNYHVGSTHLIDAGGRKVGHIMIFVNSTLSHTSINKTTIQIAVVGLIIGILFAVLFWLYFGFFQKKLVSIKVDWDEKNLDNQKCELALKEKTEAIEKDNQYHQRGRIEEQVLGSLMRLALDSTSLDGYLQASLEKLLSSISWLEHLPEGALFLVKSQADEEVLELAASFNLSPVLMERCAQVPFGYCLCGRAALSREPLFVSCIDERHDIRFDSMSPHGHYVIPILKGEVLLGIFNIYLPHGVQQNIKDETFLIRVADVFSLGITGFRSRPLQESKLETFGESDE